MRRVLAKEKINFDDYLLLLSDAASEILEELAIKSHELTKKFFGKTIRIYAPLYLCNECDNNCSYCGFSQKLPEKRICLSEDEVLEEAQIIYQKGFRHILLVSGEKRDKVSLPYLKNIIAKLHEKFESISLEIFPLSEDEYRELFSAGADGVTLYQEVYDPEIYKQVHLSGPKADYAFRLQAPERAGRAGFYRINVGTLLGLGEWQKEAASLGKHVAYLKKTFWQAEIAVSFPRLKSSAAHFKPPHPVSDRQLVQMLCALRIFQPSLGLVLSTRESQGLRDNLIPLGITQMSAESKTSPGGYGKKIYAEEQFEVADQRSVAEVAAAIAHKNYEPVFKDWDKQFIC
ncbi:MAG: 2-iminoacetate synthase ThiH [Candidatus Saganbacteria bacterium]|nr:2-iminoacetate synthase ThiH [Candidatus Saganbacteria bacterium]